LRFDELTQTLIWPVADAFGRWIGLTLSYEGVERDRIAVLERLAGMERFGHRVRRRGRHGAQSLRCLGRLRTSIATAGGGPTAFAPRRGVTDRLLDSGWDLVMRRAEAGRGLAREAFRADAAALVGRLSAAGLSPLARPCQALADDAAPEDAALRAAFSLSTARRARLRLAWMT
jgi:hypothetical protein